jgi:hypothetical protein
MAILSYDSLAYRVYSKGLNTLGNLNWNKIKEKITGRRYYDLTDPDLDLIREMLAKNYFIIATRRKTVLSTYMIGAATLIKTGKTGHYDHVLLNLEDDDPADDEHYQLYESTSKGAHISTFMEVFNCDSVALMRPKNMPISEWHAVVDFTKTQIGKPYDNVFNLNDDTRVSCVELVRNALRAVPDYDKRFPNFETAIKKAGNLAPQMYYDCPDFEVIYEIRR